MLFTSNTYHVPFAEVAVRMLNMTVWQQIEKLEELEKTWQKEQSMMNSGDNGLPVMKDYIIGKLNPDYRHNLS